MFVMPGRALIVQALLKIRRAKKVCALLLASLSAGGLLFAQGLTSTGARTAASVRAITQQPTDRATLSERVSVQAAGRGNPQINLSDGREVVTAYSSLYGAGQELEQNQARGLSLTSADFDEDGVADLVSGYAAQGGIVTLHRGNVDSINPYSPDAQQRRAEGAFTDSPFLSPARVFHLPEAVDFLGAGDFDGDGHTDVVAARRGGGKLYLLSGDGRGGLGGATEIDLPGAVTALTVGQINRRDTQAKLAVGVVAADGAKVLIFNGAEGALKSEAEIIALPAEAKAMAAGQLDASPELDLAVAAGQEMIIVHGLSKRPGGGKAKLSKVSFSAPVKSLVIGDFTARGAPEVAALTEAGSVELVRRKAPEADNDNSHPAERWETESLGVSNWSAGHQLASARVSGSIGDDLLVLDRATSQVHILKGAQARGEDGDLRAASSEITEQAALDTNDEPVAVLAMRLNEDALSDLVILKGDRAAPTVVLSAPVATFVVSNVNDSGAGSLRQAITDANNSAGADSITFNIGSGQKTINLLSELPEVTGAVTINGASQPGYAGSPLIELNGASAGTGKVGIKISAGSSTVRGLVVNRFNSTGLWLLTGGGNIIANNYIGTDPSGSTDLGNGLEGVFIQNSPSNTIGGTASSDRNVISGNNRIGIWILGASSNANSVYSNYIGVSSNGASSIGNSSVGVQIDGAPNSNIGSGSTGRNVISGNNSAGVFIVGSGATATEVRGNYIGTNAAGTAALSNLLTGVEVNGPAGTTISSSTICSNGFHGILIHNLSTTAETTLIQSNSIGLSGTSAFGNSFSGVYVTNAYNCKIDGNTVAFNGSRGVVVQSGTGNRITLNNIYSNNGIGIDLGDDNKTSNDAGDGDSGANGLQNYPIINTVISSSQSATISGTLNSLPNRSYSLNFFYNSACDPSGNGEGQLALFAAFGFSFSVDTDANGNGSFNFQNVNLPGILPGGLITATATDSTTNNTSEFSPCAPVCFVSCAASGPSMLPAGSAGSFYASATTSSCAGTITYDWNFGDGTAHSTQQNPAHTYAVIGAYEWSVTVRLNGIVTCTQKGSVTATGTAPVIYSFSPAGGPVGTSVTITGENFTPASMVKFNVTAASFQVNNSNQITATVPAGATTGPITVQTPSNGAAVSSSSFTVITAANSATMTVNSTADSDAFDSVLTLREAILIAEGLLGIGSLSTGEKNQVAGTPTAASLDQIFFNIPTSDSGYNAATGRWTISPTFALPTIANKIIIDGYTQPGSSKNTLADGDNAVLRVVLSGAGAGTGVDGLAITAGGSTVRGLVINGFRTNANVNPHAGGNGIALQTNGNNLIEGNFIGTSADGNSDVGNEGHGVSITSGGNTVGGTTPAARNILSGNGARGVRILGNLNRVQGNYIGTNAAGTGNLGNSDSGVSFAGDNNTVGGRLSINGTASGAGNRIAFNAQAGIDAGDISAGLPSLGNSFLLNTIFSNPRGDIRLGLRCGIDISCNLLSPPTLANSGVAAPVLRGVSSSNGQTTFEVEITGSTPNTNFFIEFFAVGTCDSFFGTSGGSSTSLNSGFPVLIHTDQNGNASQQFILSVSVAQGGFVNARATSQTNNSSETSNCVQVGNGACTYTVSPNNPHLSSGGGNGSVSVTTQAGCSWTAQFTGGFVYVNVISGSGTGSGSFTFSVTENTETFARYAIFDIGGRTVTIEQDGRSCTFDIPSTSQRFTSGSGAASISIFGPGGCPWTASANGIPWIHITSGASGNGNGAVQYTVDANTDASPRSGYITVADQLYSIYQEGVSCTYSLSPSASTLLPAGGGGSSFTVTTQSICGWSAAPGESWIHITSGVGPGTAGVSYTVDANPNASQRAGFIFVQGEGYTVNQAGMTACTYSASPTSATVASGGGPGSFTLSTQAGCSWAATSDAVWLTTSSSGTGGGTVNYSVAQNTTTSPRTGHILINGQQLYTVNQNPQSPAQFDFDGDKKTDIAIYRPSEGRWYITNSSNNTNSFPLFGVSTDKIAPGDYDGDGRTDVAIYRPGAGAGASQWYVIYSSTGAQQPVIFWGAGEDYAVPADYDGDGRTDVAVFRPSNGGWFIRSSQTGNGLPVVGWGMQGDIPVPGDYDGDGTADIAVWRPATGAWYFQKDPAHPVTWGINTQQDVAVPADYDGDRKTDVAVWRASTGVWHIIGSLTGTPRPTVAWGISTDKPVAGDFDADGKTDIAVWRSNPGIWYIINSTNSTQQGITYGTVGDVPVPSAFIR